MGAFHFFIKALLILVFPSLAFSAQIPPDRSEVKILLPLPTLNEDWDTIHIRLDIRNLIGPNGEGRLDRKLMLDRVDEINRIWSQCSVRFNPRKVSNINALKLKIPYRPKSQGDLGQIASALNPHGFTAIPLTIAGPWGFYDPASGVYPFGYGWVFTRAGNPKEIERIGAMISATKAFSPTGAKIFAHELGHALSLDESGNHPDLMGMGIETITFEQCNQARQFARRSLSMFL